MTKIIGESDTSISRLQWEKKKQKLLSQTQNRSHADSVPGRGCKTVTGFVKMHMYTTQMYNQEIKERPVAS